MNSGVYKEGYMSNWYEVFDNENVQLNTRRQATHLSLYTALAVMLTFLITALALEGTLPLPTAGILLVVLWAGLTSWLSYRMRKLRRIMWCVKVSPDRIVGYDYTRHKTVLDWPAVHRVELAPKGLLLAGEDHCTLEIPHLFPDFHLLSHRIVQHAETHSVPILIDGQPWESVDVYHLFPFLTNDASGTAA